MQTIARANRVFPDKDNGLIVDYVGVFRNLEKALAIYGADRAGSGADLPIRPKDDLVAELGALVEVAEFCDANDIDLDDMEAAQGFEFIALQKAAVEALLIDEQTRRRYVSLARQVRKIFKALLPDPEAMAVAHRVAVIRSIGSKIESASEAPDIRGVMDSVAELLDRSVGAKEYIIRSAGGFHPLIDLNRLDFEQLSLDFAANKRTAALAIENNLAKRLVDAVRKNPTQDGVGRAVPAPHRGLQRWHPQPRGVPPTAQSHQRRTDRRRAATRSRRRHRGRVGRLRPSHQTGTTPDRSGGEEGTGTRRGQTRPRLETPPTNPLSRSGRSGHRPRRRTARRLRPRALRPQSRRDLRPHIRQLLRQRRKRLRHTRC